MTREPGPTQRDQRIESLARDVLALHRALDRHLADFDDRLRAVETFAAKCREPAAEGSSAGRSNAAGGAPAMGYCHPSPAAERDTTETTNQGAPHGNH